MQRELESNTWKPVWNRNRSLNGLLANNSVDLLSFKSTQKLSYVSKAKQRLASSKVENIDNLPAITLQINLPENARKTRYQSVCC